MICFSLELKTRKKECLKEAYARIAEYSQKDGNPEEEIVKPKKIPKSRLLPKFYSTVKRQTIPDLRKLLLWKENPSDFIRENNTDEPDILEIFGPNENIKNVLKINGELTVSIRALTKYITVCNFRKSSFPKR